MNFVYAHLSQGMNRVQKAEFDSALSAPEDKEKARDEMNRRAMLELQSRGGFIRPPKAS